MIPQNLVPRKPWFRKTQILTGKWRRAKTQSQNAWANLDPGNPDLANSWFWKTSIRKTLVWQNTIQEIQILQKTELTKPCLTKAWFEKLGMAFAESRFDETTICQNHGSIKPCLTKAWSKKLRMAFAESWFDETTICQNLDSQNPSLTKPRSRKSRFGKTTIRLNHDSAKPCFRKILDLPKPWFGKPNLPKPRFEKQWFRKTSILARKRKRAETQSQNAWRTGYTGSPKQNLFCMDKTDFAKPRFAKTKIWLNHDSAKPCSQKNLIP